MKQIHRNYLGRVLLYVTGLFCLALGVAFSVNSNLGVSPVNSLPYIISLIVPYDMGICVMAVFSIYILLQILILRKEFKWINLTQLLFSILFGYFVDMAKWMVGDFRIPTYLGQLMMLAISIALVAAGVSLYMSARIVNMPMEGLTHVISEKFFPKLTFQDVKVIMDCVIVAIGLVLSVICLKRVEGIREGTILCALLVGKIMKPIQKVIGPKVERLYVGEG